MFVCSCMLLSLSIFAYVNGNTDGQSIPDKPYDHLFQDGMMEYKNRNHERSSILIKKAIQDYKFVREIAAQCWIKCREEFSKTKLRYISILDGQLNFLHYSIKMKACSKSCKEKFLGKRKE